MRLGELGHAMNTLYIARTEKALDRRVLGGIMMNTLKNMMRQGQHGRNLAWEYFRQMQQADAANDRHYTKMLQACQNISEIDGLMQDLDQSSTRPTAGAIPSVFQCLYLFTQLVPVSQQFTQHCTKFTCRWDCLRRQRVFCAQLGTRDLSISLTLTKGSLSPLEF